MHRFDDSPANNSANDENDEGEKIAARQGFVADNRPGRRPYEHAANRPCKQIG